MKKRFSLAILSVIFVVATLCSIMFMTTASAAEEKATLSFANKAQRTSLSDTKQVWEQNGITFTNDKSASTTKIADYAKPVRLYASSKITVSAPGTITKIVFDCNNDSYATALKNSIGSTATVSVSSDKVTAIPSGSSSEFVISKLSAQVRMDSLEVFYEMDDSACEHVFDKGEVTTPKTCDKEGVLTKTCTICGEKDTDIIPPSHEYELVEDSESSCSEAGRIVKECSECGEKDITIKDKLDHNLGEDGICTVCGQKPPYVITFGANGSASHNDGTTIGTSKGFTEDGYSITISSAENVYSGARDAKGNSCLKLGTGSKAGKFNFVVADDVESVVIHVAMYKGNAATVTVNGTAYTLVGKSDDGVYDAIEIDTTENKTISFAVSSGYRCMIDAIDFYVAAPELPEEPTPEEPITSAIIKGASITAGADLALNYIVAIPADHNLADYKMIIKMNGKEYIVCGDVDVNGENVFSFKNIGPQSICDLIDAELYYGEEFVAEKLDYSIKQYAIDFLDAFGNNPEYASLKAILGDILAYGEAAYEFVTGEDAGDNFKVDGLNASDAVPVDRAGASLSKTEGDVKFTAAGVEYYVSNKIYVKFAAAEGVVLYVNGVAVEADSYADGMYIFYTDEIFACDFNKVFTFELKSGDEVIQTLTYSINSYAYAMYKADGSVRSNLALALYRYGVSSYKFYNPEN